MSNHVPGLFALAGMELELTEMVGRKADLRTPEDLNPYFRDKAVAAAQERYTAVCECSHPHSRDPSHGRASAIKGRDPAIARQAESTRAGRAETGRAGRARPRPVSDWHAAACQRQQPLLQHVLSRPGSPVGVWRGRPTILRMLSDGCAHRVGKDRNVIDVRAGEHGCKLHKVTSLLN